MNTWQNAVITNKGLALQAKLIAGTTLNITRAVTGSGYVTPGLLQQQTAVTSPQQTMSFRTITYPEIGEACVPVYIENDGLATGYTAMQVGIYATDPDEGEILFFIAQAQSGTGTVVPSETESPGYSAEWNFYFQYGQADDVNVTVDPSNTVSHAEFEAHVNDKDNPHDVTRAQLGLGVTAVTTAGTDLDTYTSRGIFTFASAYAPINAPTGNANGWLFVIPWNEPESVATVKQVWMRHGAVSSNDHESYIRTRIASTGLWSNWAKVITTEDLQNNGTTTEAGYALDAQMGKTLQDGIDILNDKVIIRDVTTANTDLDTYLDQGIYTFASAYAPTNAPSGNTNGWLFVIPWNKTGSVATIKQIWMRHGAVSSNDHETYIRTRIASQNTWSSWAKAITTKDLQNNATTTADGYALDARMGKTLQGEIDTLNNSLVLTNKKWFHITNLNLPSGRKGVQIHFSGASRNNNILFTDTNKNVYIIVQDWSQITSTSPVQLSPIVLHEGSGIQQVQAAKTDAGYRLKFLYETAPVPGTLLSLDGTISFNSQEFTNS